MAFAPKKTDCAGVAETAKCGYGAGVHIRAHVKTPTDKT